MIVNESTSLEIEKWVSQFFSNEIDSGHDFWHTKRVRYNALNIQKAEGGDKIIIEVAALLHDLVDEKLFDSQKMNILILEKLKGYNFSENQVRDINEIINNLSFSKELEGMSSESTEFKIVQDADRLDALGAIGIARAFSYGNKKQRPFFDPLYLPGNPTSKEEYRNLNSPTINHFFEKLLRLPGMMKTKTGKVLAEERTVFLKSYLYQFINEWPALSDDVKDQWIHQISSFDNN